MQGRAGTSGRSARLATTLTIATALAIAVTGAGCGSRAADLRPVDAVVVPTLAPVPDDPGDSPQLEALVERDRSGLLPTDPAEAALLEPALEALRAGMPDAIEATRISVYSTNVYMSVVDPTNSARAITVTYDVSGGLRIHEPSVNTDDSYPLAGIDATVLPRVVAGIERRFPTLRVTSIDLRRGLSYGFGLVWYLSVADAQGGVANVFVELDGTVVAVDLA